MQLYIYILNNLKLSQIIVTEIKKKWRNARTYYKRLKKAFLEANKVASGSGVSEAHYEPNWPHYESLKFLDISLEIRPSISNGLIFLFYFFVI